VVSTGGGIVLREENIGLMKDSGLVIHLYADIHKLAERLVHSTDRPLLKGNHFERLTKIQHERKGKYDFAHLSIDTTNLTLEQSVERVIEHMKENGMA
jgi:shikimate kinase